MMSARIIGTAVGIALGSFAAAQIGMASHRVEQQADDACWVKGGEYRDGKCEMPQDRLSPEQKVCMGMRGSYQTVKDGETKCFKQDGTEIPLPDLRGREVSIKDDGTVVVKGPDRIDYYMGVRDR